MKKYLLITLIIVLGLACATPLIPIPIPDPELEPGTSTSQYKIKVNLAGPEYCGTYLFAINLQTGKGVIAQFVAAGTICQVTTEELLTREGDVVEVWIKRDSSEAPTEIKTYVVKKGKLVLK